MLLRKFSRYGFKFQVAAEAQAFVPAATRLGEVAPFGYENYGASGFAQAHSRLLQAMMPALQSQSVT